MDDALIGGDVDAAVFARGGKTEDVVVLVDGAADGAETVMTVGESVGKGEFRKAAGTGGLDDADVSDVMADERVEGDAQVIHIVRAVMGGKRAVGHGALAGFLLGETCGFGGLAVDKVHAVGVQGDHRGTSFLWEFRVLCRRGL